MEDKLAEEILIQCKEYNGEVLRKEIQEKGYTVVPNVVPPKECDKYIKQYKTWLSRFGEENKPSSSKSVIQQYRVGHYEPTWRTRLWTKPVFDALWETKKLLTTTDGIAIGEPPELGRTQFRESDSNWFHIDQGSWREGLHAYQGAVYLEETTEEDYCFRVIEGSPQNHTEFFKEFPDAAKGAAGNDHYRLSYRYVDWYKENGGKEKLIPVPKGGMLLCDPRIVHDTVPPLNGRINPNRWRFVIFVTMTPAIWATEEDITLKRKAYNEMVGTSHWSSRGIRLFPSTNEAEWCKDKKIIETITEQPPIAKSRDVKLLAGIEEYDFDDGNPNGPGWEPKWNVD